MGQAPTFCPVVQVHGDQRLGTSIQEKPNENLIIPSQHLRGSEIILLVLVLVYLLSEELSHASLQWP